MRLVRDVQIEAKATFLVVCRAQIQYQSEYS